MKTTSVQSAFDNHCWTLFKASPKSFRAVRLALLCCLLLGAVQPVRAQQNTPPTISAIPDQVSEEDVPLIGIPFTVWDAETPPDQLRVSGKFLLPGPLYGLGSMVIGGTGTNRWLSLFTPPNISGTGSVGVVVYDAGGLSASTSFRVEIRPVNDPPWLSPIPDQVALKGQGLFAVPFSAWDVESSSKINFQAWSSRQAVVSNSALRITPGFGVSNRVLQITLSTQGAAGSSAITIQANDQQDTNRVSFILNVVEPEFARFATNQAPSVAQGFQPVWGDLNGDGLLDLVVSPTQILTNNGLGALVPGISMPGFTGITGAAPGDFDGDGNLDLLLMGGFAHLLRNNGGNPLTFSEVSLPVRTQLGSRAFWVDVDGDGDLDIVPEFLSGGTTWLRNDGRGSFANVSPSLPVNVSGRVLAVGDFDNDGDPDLVAATAIATPTYLQLYENDGSGHFQAAPISLPQAKTLAAGWADVDGDGFLDLWLVQASLENRTNTLVILRQIPPGRFTETFRLNFPTTFSSSGAVTNLAWADFDNDGYMDFAGPFFIPAQIGVPTTNYTVIYHNDGSGRFTTTGLPAALERGQLLPVVGDFNDDGSADLLYRGGNTLLSLRNQTRALNSLPDAPSGLRAFAAGNLVTLFWNDAHDGNQTAPLTYNVRIGTAPGRNDVVPSMSTTNGVRMIPAPGNAGFNNWMVLELPFDQFNVETLYWSAQAVDASFQGGPFAAEQTFFINPPGNTPPSIVGIGDIAFPEDATSNITFYIRDDRTPPDDLRVQAISSNPFLIPANRVRLSDFTSTDQGLRVKLSLTPLTNQFGDTTITVTATDRGGLSASRFFVATVTPMNDPPSITASETLLGPAGAPSLPLPIQVSDPETPAEQLVVTARSLTPGVVTDSNLALTHGSAGNWNLVVTPVTAEPAQAQIELTVTDPQGAQAKQTVSVFFQQQLLTPYASLSVTGSWPNQVIWADLNSDRRMELLVGNFLADGVTLHGVEAGSLPFLSQLMSPTNHARVVDMGDVDNDGSVDLLVSGGLYESNMWSAHVFVLRNRGEFQFERLRGAVFDFGAAHFADLDLDGRLDVLVAESTTNLAVYRNTGAGFETGRHFLLNSSLPDAEADSLTSADLDSDGRDELVLAINNVAPGYQAVFRWAGDGFVAITNAWASTPIRAVEDFDQDGLPDLVTSVGWPVSRYGFWRNSGGLEFAQVGSAFSNAYDTGIVGADFDSDGVPDVLDYGHVFTNVLDYGHVFNSLYLGHSDFTFTSSRVLFGSVSAAVPDDFDHDGVMDVAAITYLTNLPMVGEITSVEVYRGQSRTTNHPPASPSKLRARTISTNEVMLSWDRAKDPEQSGGLTYNLRVGTAPGRGDVVSPMSLADGFRLLPRIGNAEWSTNRLLTALQPGATYYWSVQAVDNSYAGGPFAPEVFFTVPAASIMVNSLAEGQIELELRAAPGTAWRLEASSDLKNWSEYPATDAQTWTNGVCWIRVGPSSSNQFFRAKQMR